MKKSQTKRILDYLLTGKGITAIQALKMFGCFRLSGRIYEIRNQYEVKVESNFVKRNGKTFCEYFLKP